MTRILQAAMLLVGVIVLLAACLTDETEKETQ